MKSIYDVLKYLKEYEGQDIKIMEVCGTHTDSILKNGIRSLISDRIRLISGPGCPVCVTAAPYIDQACEIAGRERHAVYTFGDMMRVKGAEHSLSEVKSQGGRVEIIYSPLEVLDRAKKERATTHVMLAVGFETTAPVYGLLLQNCIEEKADNVKLFTSLKRIIPALENICGLDDISIDGFICPGHVSVTIGEKPYLALAEVYGKPFTISGFSAHHIIMAIYDLVCQISSGKAEVHNLYKSTVRANGNAKSRELIDRYFEAGTAVWRGIGEIKSSGLYLRKEYSDYGIICVSEPEKNESSGCMCGKVMTGGILPSECPMFGKTCKPEEPIGPCMVSAEGSCGIWYRYMRM